MGDRRSPLLKRALAATEAFYVSQAATGTDSEDTEGWRDTCDDLFQQLTPAEQKAIKAWERRLRRKAAKETS